MTESHYLYTEAPHTGLELAISNVSAAASQGVEIRPAALRVAARRLVELAEHHERNPAKEKVA